MAAQATQTVALATAHYPSHEDDGAAPTKTDTNSAKTSTATTAVCDSSPGVIAHPARPPDASSFHDCPSLTLVTSHLQHYRHHRQPPVFCTAPQRGDAAISSSSVSSSPKDIYASSPTAHASVVSRPVSPRPRSRSRIAQSVGVARHSAKFGQLTRTATATTTATATATATGSNGLNYSPNVGVHSRACSDQAPRATSLPQVLLPRRAASESYLSPTSSDAVSSHSQLKLQSTLIEPTPLRKAQLKRFADVSILSAESSPSTLSTALAQRREEPVTSPAVSPCVPANEISRTTVKQLHSYYPPVTRPPPFIPSTPVRVPPIRSFRSSGSRKSLALDMNTLNRSYEVGDGVESAIDGHTLRGLDPRYDRNFAQMTPPASAHQDGDEVGDVFLNIAREEAYRRADAERVYTGSYTPLSGVSRSGHRRPLSTNVASYQPASPPKTRRRLSDQQERERASFRTLDEDQSSQISRISNIRPSSRDRALSSQPAEDTLRSRANATLRASPLASRSPVYQEFGADALRSSRRRSSITESTPPVSGRQYKSALTHGHNKMYSSSPLVRSFDARSQHPQEGSYGVEGTESTASTTAPSTVWDELDDIKSRIHRLELTGTLPSTSGAAVARLSDERPATATTTNTTASLSPKRTTAVHADTYSTTSSQRDAHPLLQSALGKSKQILDQHVYKALECAAQDAIGLSSMMGLPGHPGPISSGTSTVGSGVTVTDRQLRRKADSVCRSLTELCLALTENAVQHRLANEQIEPQQGTPAMPKTMTGLPISRRSSIIAEQTLPASQGSPRVISKYEERRNTVLQGTAPPVSLHTNPQSAVPGDTNMSRRSSLLLSRTRRGKTEEPEEGRGSPYLRPRRAGTEEPDAGRTTSLLIRNRRGTADEADGLQFRPPSRSNTDVNVSQNFRQYSENHAIGEEADSAASSNPSRRRFVSDLHSRIVVPAGSGVTHQRKYLERSTPTLDKADRGVENGDSRRFSLHSKTGSLNSRLTNRTSMIPTVSASPVEFGAAK